MRRRGLDDDDDERDDEDDGRKWLQVRKRLGKARQESSVAKLDLGPT